MTSLNTHTTALVTGGAGFIGSHVTDSLVTRGVKVRVLDNLSTGFEHNLSHIAKDIEWHHGDLRDANLLQKAVQGVDVIFHLAALPSVPRSLEDPISSCDINIMGSLLLFEAARRAGVKRVVFSASSSAYGESKELPKQEHFTPQPLSPYAVGKLTVEQLGVIYTKVYHMEVVSLRYFNVYGSRQDPHSDYAAVIPSFLNAAFHKKPALIYGTGEQTRDFTFVQDVVDANFKAATVPQAPGETFNIAGGRQITINELVSMIAQTTGVSIPPAHAQSRPGEVMHSHASIAKAREKLGWTPQTPLDAGLRRTWEWFSQAWAKKL